MVNASWDDVFVINLNHSIEFGGNAGDVVVDHNLGSGVGLFLFESADFDKDFGGFREVGENFREFFVDVESSFFGLNGPFFAVSVTIESDVLGFGVEVGHD
jgi:hypothetical protein